MLHVFPLEVEFHSFVYNRPVSGELALYNLDAAVTDEPIAVAPVVDGLGVLSQLPRGDYEVVMLQGGTSPRSPVILTGPKVERITVVTQQLWWLIAPLASSWQRLGCCSPCDREAEISFAHHLGSDRCDRAEHSQHRVYPQSTLVCLR